MMDTTEGYILQCEQAKKLQEGWVPRVGDWYLQDGILRVIGSDEGQNLCSEAILDSYRTNSIWLFRWDQLHDMVEWDDSFYIQIGKNLLFDKFYPVMVVYNRKDEVTLTSGDYIKTREQLLLAFVMFKLFSKKWSGTAWEKI